MQNKQDSTVTNINASTTFEQFGWIVLFSNGSTVEVTANHWDITPLAAEEVSAYHFYTVSPVHRHKNLNTTKAVASFCVADVIGVAPALSLKSHTLWHKNDSRLTKPVKVPKTRKTVRAKPKTKATSKRKAKR